MRRNRRGGIASAAASASFVGLLGAMGCTRDTTLTTQADLAGDDAGLWLSDDAAGSSQFVLDAGPVPTGRSTPFSPQQPSFGPVTVASSAPRPISGGTLLVTHDGTHAIAADPDRDVIYVVDLGKQTVTATLVLDRGDEPGRLVEDGAGRVHVALRGGGALVTLDVGKGSVTARRDVCPAPRGVAWAANTDSVWVACATGELVALPASGGAATTTFVVERDLRDVVVRDGSLAVSQFRTAKLLNLDGAGNVTRTDALPSPLPLFTPHVAWRTVAGPKGTVVAVHQAESTQSIGTQQTGGYGSAGGGCLGMTPASRSPAGGPSTFDACAIPSGDAGSFNTTDAAVPPPSPFSPFSPCGTAVVSSVLTVLAPDGHALVNASFAGTLPVDVAVSADGTAIAAVAPGNSFSTSSGSGTMHTLFVFTSCGQTTVGTSVGTQVTAVAFDAKGRVLVQSREPANLTLVDPQTGTTLNVTKLAGDTRDDTGHDVFHTQAGEMIACASCHPEGRDDGHVWRLDGALRRTPSLRGTIAGTAPYHWPGDQTNLDVLVNDVYTVRMGGVMLDSPTMSALTGWVQNVPSLPAPAWVDRAAAARGKAIFDGEAGCFTCHSGPKLTNNHTVDVGTGGAFQVPPLVGVGWRTPLFHDGCAKTLADRFGACATDGHGSIGALSSADISDLIAYLESL